MQEMKVIICCTHTVVSHCPRHQYVHEVVRVQPIIKLPWHPGICAVVPLLGNAHHIDNGTCKRQRLRTPCEVAYAPQKYNSDRKLCGEQSRLETVDAYMTQCSLALPTCSRKKISTFHRYWVPDGGKHVMKLTSIHKKLMDAHQDPLLSNRRVKTTKNRSRSRTSIGIARLMLFLAVSPTRMQAPAVRK